MPAVKQINTDQHQILLWKIEESLEFFSQKVILSFKESREYTLIKRENRKLEWMAARFVLRQIINDNLLKDTFGKPHLYSKEGFISLSHCKNYAVAVYSKNKRVGIDIELIHEKILRIANKFMSEKEFAFIDEQNKITHLIACWSIKEAVYKFYGKKKLNFKEQIVIDKFCLNDKYVNVNLYFKNYSTSKRVYFLQLTDIMLTYL